MTNSLGLLEVKGIATAAAGLNEMLKNTSVNFIKAEKKLGAGLVTVIVEGMLSEVETAVDFGENISKNYGQVITATTIANPHFDIINILKNNDFNNTDSETISVGIAEIYGYAATLVAADTALKTADVSLLGFGKTKGKPKTPGLIMFLKLYGQVDAVESSISAAIKKGNELTGVITSLVIANAKISI